MKWSKKESNTNISQNNNSTINQKSAIINNQSPTKNNKTINSVRNNTTNVSKSNSSPKRKLIPGTYQEILYTKPNKPLDFSFRDLVHMKGLITAVPRQGIRKQVNTNNENINNNTNNKNIFQQEGDENLKDFSYPSAAKKKKQEVKEEIVEGKIFGDRSNDNNKAKKRNELMSLKSPNVSSYEKITIQKVIKYLPYTNAIILHSNSINSLEDIHIALNEVLPEVEFLNKQNNNYGENNNFLPPISRSLEYTQLDLLQWIDLSHNKIESIHKDILKIPFLKILYLHANYIKSLEEITNLSQCKALINLTLHGNPIEHIKGYRLLVIEMIGTLEKLNFTLVSEKELDIIHYKGARFGEKRSSTGEIISYPQLDKEILKRMNIPVEDDKKDL